MSAPDTDSWSDYLRRTLECYDAALLRHVAAKLLRPRSQWPTQDLIERCLVTLGNTAAIDRRLQELDLPGQRLLACIAHSRQPRWRLGNLLELLAALGDGEGLQSVFRLFEAGFLYPDLLAQGERSALTGNTRKGHHSARSTQHSVLNTQRSPLKSFEQWLGQGSVSGFSVIAHPNVMNRALGVDLGLPALPSTSLETRAIHEADGLEWPLRMAVHWQQLADSPLRRTQLGDFFKRDLEKLRADPLLNAAPADKLVDLPDTGPLAVALAQLLGIVQVNATELGRGSLPSSWDEGLPGTLAALWEKLPFLDNWNPRDGWCGPSSAGGHPYPSAYLLALLLLANLPQSAWVRPAEVERWLLEHHPFWQGEKPRPGQRRSWVPAFLMGFAYQLRMLQAARNSAGEWVVRLAPLGRWLLGLSEMPAAAASSPQTLVVQPNLEIVVYRQGLTPELVAMLSRVASWKSLGAACTLQLRADTVYRGLETGLTFESLVQALEKHGMRELPPAVVSSLRTWADKRERISVYSSATLFEFANAEDLNDALARGVHGVRLSERLLVVPGDDAVDFRHFRLAGTRDYSLSPEKCVAVEADGVTLAIDLARSDLLLETELQRFAEALDSTSVNGKRRYRLTPASLAAGRSSGLGLRDLDEWFAQRAGQSLSPAARMFFQGGQLPPVELRPQLVLHVATPELADGLLQWPATRSLILERLGPTSLAIAEEDTEGLQQQLSKLGVNLKSVDRSP